MAATLDGELLAIAFQKNLALEVEEITRESGLITVQYLDPLDPDGTAMKWLTQMMGFMLMAADRISAQSAAFNRLYREAEGILGLPPAPQQYMQKMDMQAAARRMMGAGVYGYKGKLSAAGKNTKIVGADNQQFRETVNRVASDASTKIMEPSRKADLKFMQEDRYAIGFGRKTGTGACDFCLTMSLNNDMGWYKSEKTADFRAHGKCSCKGIVIYDNWEPDADAEEAYSRFSALEADRATRRGKDIDSVWQRAGKRDDNEVKKGKITEEEAIMRQDAREDTYNRKNLNDDYKAGKIKKDEYDEEIDAIRTSQKERKARYKEIEAEKLRAKPAGELGIKSQKAAMAEIMKEAK